MVLILLLIPHKHRRYSYIDKYGDAIALYNHHSKYIYRQRQIA